MFTHMNYIYEVYRERSFSKAAQKLYISQSSLSLTIKHAEEKIGMQIFDRSTYPIQLTEFGSLYIHAVEEIRNITNNLTNYIYDINNLKRGEISVGSGNFLTTYLVAPAILTLKKRYPNISAKLLEGRTKDLEHKLAIGDIDVLVTNGHLDESSYKKTFLFEEHMILAVPLSIMPEPLYPEFTLSYEDIRNNSIFTKSGVLLKGFESIPFIGMRQGNDSRIRTDKIFADACFSPKIVLELDQSSTTFRLSHDGMGACIVTDTVIRQLGHEAEMVFYRIDHPHANRDVSIYTRNVSYVTRTMDVFINILQGQI
ncbi:MAG: LysR family transcriptional regulator [Clostridiales bacterium]|nr:LysR family transcriptional regulator [Clostridiales bacterium]